MAQLLDPKAPWQSKTLWLNVIAFVLLVLTLLSGPEFLALIPDQYEENLLKGIAFLTVMLNGLVRFFTSQPIGGVSV